MCFDYFRGRPVSDGPNSTSRLAAIRVSSVLGTEQANLLPSPSSHAFVLGSFYH